MSFQIYENPKTFQYSDALESVADLLGKFELDDDDDADDDDDYGYADDDADDDEDEDDDVDNGFQAKCSAVIATGKM